MTETLEQIKVQRRSWLDKRTNTREVVIVIRHGPVFVRIPLSEAYDVVNQVHDLVEAYEACVTNAGNN